MNEHPESTEANASHHADAGRTASSSAYQPLRTFEVEMHRTDHYCATLTVRARDEDGAEIVANQLANFLTQAQWGEVDSDIDAFEVRALTEEARGGAR
jgi:hypothetical protein